MGIVLGPSVSQAMSAFGSLVKECTELQPFWMGILVSVIMGMVLTLPIQFRGAFDHHRIVRSRGRRGNGGMLLSDDWFCGGKLPGKRI